MPHFNATIATNKYIIAGDKQGYVYLFNTKSLKCIHKLRATCSIIQSISFHYERLEFLLLSIDFSIIYCRVKDSKIEILNKFSGLEYITNDNYRVVMSESQAVAISKENALIAFRNPTAALTILDCNNLNNPVLINTIRFDCPGDIVTLHWHDNQNLLVGFGSGEILLTDTKNIIQQWKHEELNETIHWFEPLPNNQYIIATDSRRIVHLDLNTRKIKLGPVFAKDDFEHICYDIESKRVFATSFDRNIYEICLKTLSAKSVIYTAPFKLRWLNIIKINGKSFLIAQVRNGSIHKICLETKNLIGSIQGCTQTLWTAIDLKGKRRIFGENKCFIKTTHDIYETEHALDTLSTIYKDHYIKRSFGNNDNIVTGGTNGLIAYYNTANSEKRYYHLHSAIRDLCLTDKGELFVITENGELWYSPNPQKHDPSIKFKTSSEPLWSLAYNNYFQLLSVGERMGRLLIFDKHFNLIIESDTRLPKRMKWIDNNKLFICS
jgi:hypothetical protein